MENKLPNKIPSAFFFFAEDRHMLSHSCGASYWTIWRNLVLKECGIATSSYFLLVNWLMVKEATWTENERRKEEAYNLWTGFYLAA